MGKKKKKDEIRSVSPREKKIMAFFLTQTLKIQDTRTQKMLCTFCFKEIIIFILHLKKKTIVSYCLSVIYQDRKLYADIESNRGKMGEVQNGILIVKKSRL